MGERLDITRIPQPVRVAFRTFRLELWDNWSADRAERFAECDFAAGKIRLCPWMDDEKAANSLLHELLHALWIVWCLPQKGVCEEDAASCLSNGLSTVILDNPGLFAWIERALQRG